MYESHNFIEEQIKEYQLNNLDFEYRCAVKYLMHDISWELGLGVMEIGSC